jgi:hypothetical protein
MIHGRPDVRNQTVATKFNEQRLERPPTDYTTVEKFIFWCACFTPSCTPLKKIAQVL